MKDYPQNKKQWAKEAFQALELAWKDLKSRYPFPTETNKRTLIEKAAMLACDNRDITDLTHRKHALDNANEFFMSDFNSRDIEQEINYSLCFLLAYFDAHASLSMIPDTLVKETIEYLKVNYDMSYEGEIKTNVLSVNFSSKN